TTDLTLGGVLHSCSDFDGFHESVVVSGVSVAYSVVLVCSTTSATPDEATLTFSHELIEAATDPFGTGYYVDSADYGVIPFDGAGEVGDLCGAAATTPPEVGYYVQRSWSNAAARASHSPCVPAATETYFNTATVVADPVSFEFYGTTVATTGVHIPVGGHGGI